MCVVPTISSIELLLNFLPLANLLYSYFQKPYIRFPIMFMNLHVIVYMVSNEHIYLFSSGGWGKTQ